MALLIIRNCSKKGRYYRITKKNNGTVRGSSEKKLKAAGITPFSVGYAEWWVLGNHGLNIAFATQPDPDAFVQGLNAGTSKIAGNEQFQKNT
ncbi:hypothetical protein GCM10020331_040050 [Ectobacillus funiculus]